MRDSRVGLFERPDINLGPGSPSPYVSNLMLFLWKKVARIHTLRTPTSPLTQPRSKLSLPQALVAYRKTLDTQSAYRRNVLENDDLILLSCRPPLKSSIYGHIADSGLESDSAYSQGGKEKACVSIHLPRLLVFMQYCRLSEWVDLALGTRHYEIRAFLRERLVVIIQ